jgi:hypothetical protein
MSWQNGSVESDPSGAERARRRGGYGGFTPHGKISAAFER